MMNDPNMMKMFGGLGNMANQQLEENNEVQDESIDVDNDDNEIYEFTEGDSVFITGLKNDLYNNNNNRYNVFIESMDKVISLKAENLLSTTDNVCINVVVSHKNNPIILLIYHLKLKFRHLLIH